MREILAHNQTEGGVGPLSHLDQRAGAIRRPRFGSQGRLRVPGVDSQPDLVTISEEELRRISDQVVKNLFRLDAFLKTEGSYLIEVDNVRPELALITPKPKEEALAELQGVLDRLNRVKADLSPQWLLIKDSLRSNLFFFAEEERLKRGEPKTGYSRFLQEVSGLRPRYIPDKVVKGKIDQILDILKGFYHLQFDPNDPDSVLKTFYEYQSQSRRYRSAYEIIQRYKHFDEEVARPKIGALLGKDLSKIDYRIVVASAYVFWMMLERPGISENLIYLNWHPRHRIRWDEGRIEMYGGSHEPDHFIAAHLMQQEILKGNLDPALGVMTIPSHVAFQWEGMALTIADYANIKLSPDGQLATLVYVTEQYAINNGLFMLENDPDRTIDDVAEEIRPKMLLRSKPQIMTLLREGTTKPLERAYVPNYAQGHRFFEEFWAKASPTQRQKMAELCHTTLMSPTQLKEAGEKLLT